MNLAQSGEVVSLADFAGVKRRAHAAARRHLAKVAPEASVMATLAAYALVILADPQSSSVEKGAELASIIERAAQL